VRDNANSRLPASWMTSASSIARLGSSSLLGVFGLVIGVRIVARVLAAVEKPGGGQVALECVAVLLVALARTRKCGHPKQHAQEGAS
jgi:hypothetical protein